MALILVAEDDSGTQRLIATALRNKGHEVLSAQDGLMAWRLFEASSPDLIVSDVNMPGMNGFALLQRVRTHSTLALTPFVLLTSLQERADMRQGMLLGADDYLTKPLRPRELIEAVDAQLNRQRVRQAFQDQETRRTLSQALEQQAWDLHEQYEHRLARELSEQWPQDGREHGTSDFSEATVLFADIRNYRDWLAALPPAEMGIVLKRFYEKSGDTVHLFGATAMHFVGEGVVAIYADVESVPTAPHALRALKAALGLRKSGAAMDAHLRELFPQHHLPAFEVSIALNQGPVGMTQLEGFLGGARQLLPVGRTVADTIAMQRLAPSAAGTIVLSAPVLRRVTGAVNTVGRYLLPIDPGRAPMEVCAVQPITC
ncbi:MAG: response regulator [Burkholderiaceae bacterium]